MAHAEDCPICGQHWSKGKMHICKDGLISNEISIANLERDFELTTLRKSLETAKDERDSAIVTAYNRGVELAEVTKERDEIITIAHNRGIKDELEIDDLKVEHDRLRDLLTETLMCDFIGMGNLEQRIRKELEASDCSHSSTLMVTPEGSKCPRCGQIVFPKEAK